MLAAAIETEAVLRDVVAAVPPRCAQVRWSEDHRWARACRPAVAILAVVATLAPAAACAAVAVVPELAGAAVVVAVGRLAVAGTACTAGLVEAGAPAAAVVQAAGHAAVVGPFALLPLLLIALWSALMLRCAFVVPALWPVGLTLLLSLLLLALTLALGVYGYHRSGKQKDGGRLLSLLTPIALLTYARMQPSWRFEQSRHKCHHLVFRRGAHTIFPLSTAFGVLLPNTR